MISGTVQHGKSRGRRLGFPTINISVQQQFVEGVYVSHTLIKNKRYNSITFVGEAKTYGEHLFQAETTVFDFDQDVYGENVTVSLIKKLRGNKKFASEEELVKQMEEDRKQAENYFANFYD